MTMQKNWIGKSYGCEVDFPLIGSERSNQSIHHAPGYSFWRNLHADCRGTPLVMELSKGKAIEKDVQQFVEKVKKQDQLMRTSEYYEKEGIFLEAYCENPLTGKEMPIYATNFVLADYGTGCVMAVPTHDQRDFEFAKKFNLPLIVVIQPKDKNA